MSKVLVAVAVCMLAATAPLTAHASGTTYLGGCGIAAASLSGSGAQPTDPTQWTGFAYLDVVATDPGGLPTGGEVTASCDLVINGVPYATVLGPQSGMGAVFAAGPTPSFTVGPNDVVTWCAHVTTAWGTEDPCGPITAVSGAPGAAGDALDTANDVVGLVIGVATEGAGIVLDRAGEVLTIVTETVRESVLKPFDPTTCSLLLTLAPSVDRIFNEALLHIDDVSGDLFVEGVREYDCPPYVA